MGKIKSVAYLAEDNPKTGAVNSVVYTTGTVVMAEIYSVNIKAEDIIDHNLQDCSEILLDKPESEVP